MGRELLLMRRWLGSQSVDGVIRHSERRLVPFSAPLMYAVVADVASYQRFLPWCTASRVVHRHSDRRFDAELCVGFQLLSASYVSRVDLEPTHRVRVVSTSSPLLRSLSNDWRFEDGPDLATSWVSFDVAFELRRSGVY